MATDEEGLWFCVVCCFCFVASVFAACMGASCPTLWERATSYALDERTHQTTMSELTHERERERSNTHCANGSANLQRLVCTLQGPRRDSRNRDWSDWTTDISEHVQKVCIIFTNVQTATYIYNIYRHVLNGHCLNNLGKRPPDEVGLKIA